MENELRVSDDHRKNELSLTPGGSIVKIVYRDGKRFVYDKIKNPIAYSDHAKKNETVVEIWIDNQKYWSR
jgi:hypothetical protein